jgi:hypothetical protein
MKLTDQLTEYVNAAFTGLWIQTHEADEAEREIVQLAQERKWKLAIWDIANGLRLSGAGGGTQSDTGAGDPLAALRALPALAQWDGTALLLVHNFHRFLASPEIMQTTFAQLVAGKQQRTFVVVLSAVVQIPMELEKLFVVLCGPGGQPIATSKVRRMLDRADCPVRCYRLGAATRVIHAAEIQTLVDALRADGYLESRV